MIYLVPSLLSWALWSAVHWLTAWVVLDYAAFGFASIVSALALAVWAVETAMSRGG